MLERVKAAVKAFRQARPAAINTPQSAAAMIGTLEGIINCLPISHLRDYDSYLQACSKKVWAAWKAGDICSKIVQETPRKLMRMGGTGDEVEHQELSPLLVQANPFETMNELIARLVFHLKFTGNAFIAKDQPNIDGDRPRALYLLNPRRVILTLDRHSQVSGFTYVVGNGRTIPFDANEIIHIKLPHPDRDYWGLGEIEAAEDLYNDFINRQTWLAKFWENGASPSGILFLKPGQAGPHGGTQVVSKEEWERNKKQFQKEYGGPENSGKTAWLSGDWGYQPLGMTAQEMQSIESATWSVEQIFILAGVPLSVAGVKEAANYATAQVDEVRMRRYTIKPLVSTIEDKINSGLVRGFDPRLNLKFSVQGLIDIELSSRAVPLLVGAGIMSPNDAREFIGLERKDDPSLDQYYISAGLVPVELAGVSALDTTQQEAQAIVKRFVSETLSGKHQEQITNGNDPHLRPADRSHRR